MVRSIVAALVVLTCTTAQLAWADRTPQPARPVLNWMSNYQKAYQRAADTKRMLLVYFQSDDKSSLCRQFEEESLADERVVEQLRDYVLVKLPLDTKIKVEGEEVRLLEHRAFEDLHKKPGIAVVDLTDDEEDHHGDVVSVVPLAEGRYYRFRPNHVAVLLDLPEGTLTQRTMTFAVRIHPESPESTLGQADPVLMEAAKDHSRHQARIQNQGHHNWSSRFQHISSRLPDGLHAQEVVAESWPHQSLLDAAVDCVHSWRQSSGHWGAVRAKQPRFGYDIRRGGNGIWYATGLFGNRN